MADILLTEDEFAAIKELVGEAQATRNYFEWLSSVARRITRDDIAVPKLRQALILVEQIDLEHPRQFTHSADTAGKSGTVIEKAKPNAHAHKRRTGTTQT